MMGLTRLPKKSLYCFPYAGGTERVGRLKGGCPVQNSRSMNSNMKNKKNTTLKDDDSYVVSDVSDDSYSSHYEIRVSDSDTPGASSVPSGAPGGSSGAPGGSSSAPGGSSSVPAEEQKGPYIVAKTGVYYRILFPENESLGYCRSRLSGAVVPHLLFLRRAMGRRPKLPRKLKPTVSSEQKISKGAVVFIPDEKASGVVRLVLSGATKTFVIFDGSSERKSVDFTQTQFVLLGFERDCVSLAADVKLAMQELTKLLNRTADRSIADFWSDCISRARAPDSRMWLVSTSQNGAHRFLLADGTTFVVTKGELELLIEASEANDSSVSSNVSERLCPEVGDVIRVFSTNSRTWQSGVVLHVTFGKPRPGDGWDGQGTPMKNVFVKLANGSIVDVRDGRYSKWQRVSYLKDPFVVAEHLRCIREWCGSLQKQILAKERERERRLAKERERERRLAKERERERRLAEKQKRERRLAEKQKREQRLAKKRKREGGRMSDTKQARGDSVRAAGGKVNSDSESSESSDDSDWIGKLWHPPQGESSLKKPCKKRGTP